jgi:hypothetical protein
MLTTLEGARGRRGLVMSGARWGKLPGEDMEVADDGDSEFDSKMARQDA